MRLEAYRLRARFTVLVLSLLAFLPAQAATQGILGELLDEETGRPIVTAQVVLADSAGNVVVRALSGAAGRFFFAVDIGTYSLLVSRLGYETVHVTDVKITNESVLGLSIRLSPDAVELPGLVVQGERRSRFLAINGFYERKRQGFGHFIEIEESQRLRTFEPTDFLRRIPGLVVRNGEVRTARLSGEWEQCRLQVIVNGIYRGVNLDEVLLVQEIEAIEVYKGPATVPGRWQSLAAQGWWDFSGDNPRLNPTCGIVVVWTKH